MSVSVFLESEFMPSNSEEYSKTKTKHFLN